MAGSKKLVQFAIFAGIIAAGCRGNADDDPIIPANDAKPVVTPQMKAPPSPAYLRLHQAFKDAVVLDPPAEESRPPDRTFAGKNVASIYEQIAGKDGKGGLWERVVFINDEGKPLHSIAHVKTDLGVMQIELLSDAAPNHARNFIALAQAGYFDGLPFHRSIRKESPERTIAYLEAGCPLGTGEIGFGSIGYWLKPEFSTSLTHGEGTVGAFHGEEMETAACKFYITLGKTPWMDPPNGQYTIFGKIVGGLEVAHTINRRPSTEDDVPRDPILIREVRITQEAFP